LTRIDRARALAGELQIEVQGLVDAMIPGLHRARQPGEGAEFSEFDEYRPGDDTRHLDWKRLARTNEAVVRRHESERRTYGVIILDESESMRFPPQPTNYSDSKLGRATLLALSAAVAHLSLGDRVILCRVGEKMNRVRIDPGRDGANEAAAFLLGSNPGGHGQIGPAVEQLSEYSVQGISWVFSDFLEQDSWLPALRRVAAGNGDVRTAWIASPEERDFPYRDPARFLSLEGNESLLVDPLAIGQTYREAHAAFRADVARQARAIGAAHLEHVIDEEPTMAVLRWVDEAHAR